jgi:aspartyl-tRNA(Asn)/glutamyl-tRNA(Gln) amidotransferase subunit B
LQHIGTCDGIMAEGSLRCDVNVSVHKTLPDGSRGPGERVEVKNLNSLRAVTKAIIYEAMRQADCMDKGVPVERETRAWDTKNGTTFKLRSKEDLLDYRFMLDPDLPPLHIPDGMIDEIRDNMPELPEELFERLCKEYGLEAHEATILVDEVASVRYYEDVVRHVRNSDGTYKDFDRVCWNWVANELFGRLKRSEIPFAQCPVPAHKIAEVVSLVLSTKISGKVGKQLVEILVGGEDSREVMEIIEANDWIQISDEKILREACIEIVDNHPAEVERYQVKQQSRPLNFLVSQVIKKFDGKANPVMVKAIITELVEQK